MPHIDFENDAEYYGKMRSSKLYLQKYENGLIPQDCDAVLNPVPEYGGVNLRVFDSTFGTLKWEMYVDDVYFGGEDTLFITLIDDTSEKYSYVAKYTPGNSGIPGRTTPVTIGKKINKVKIIQEVSIDDGVILRRSPPLEYYAYDDENDIPGLSVGFNGHRFRAQKYGDYYIYRNNDAKVLFFDPQSENNTLKYKILAHSMTRRYNTVTSSYNPALWSFTIPAYDGNPEVVVSFDHDSSAGDIGAAFSGIPQILSTSITGGPLPYNEVSMSIEWVDNTLGFTSIEIDTNYIKSAETVIQSIVTGSVVGSSNSDSLFNLNYCFDYYGNLVRRDANEFDSINPLTYLWGRDVNGSSVGMNWSEATIIGGGGGFTTDNQIFIADKKIYISGTLTSGATINPQDTVLGRFDVINLTDGSFDAFNIGSGPDYTTNLFLDYNGDVLISGYDWAPNFPTGDTSKSPSEDGQFGFVHDYILSSSDSFSSAIVRYPFGINAGSIQNGIASGLFYKNRDNSSAGRICGVNYGSIRNTNFTGSAVPDKFVYTGPRYITNFIPYAPVNYRIKESARWRIGLEYASGLSVGTTTWLDYDADQTDIEAELLTTFGTNSSGGPNAVVSLYSVGEATGVGTTAKGMLWQSAAFEVSVIGAPGLTGTLPASSLYLIIEVIDDERVGLTLDHYKGSSFKNIGSMNMNTGEAVWQKSFGKNLTDNLYYPATATMGVGNNLVTIASAIVVRHEEEA